MVMGRESGARATARVLGAWGMVMAREAWVMGMVREEGGVTGTAVGGMARSHRGWAGVHWYRATAGQRADRM